MVQKCFALVKQLNIGIRTASLTKDGFLVLSLVSSASRCCSRDITLSSVKSPDSFAISLSRFIHLLSSWTLSGPLQLIEASSNLLTACVKLLWLRATCNCVYKEFRKLLMHKNQKIKASASKIKSKRSTKKAIAKLQWPINVQYLMKENEFKVYTPSVP